MSDEFWVVLLIVAELAVVGIALMAIVRFIYR